MKKIRVVKHLLVGMIPVLFVGCASVQETLYTGNVNVEAPIASPPLHIAASEEPGVVTISPKLMINNHTQIRSATDDKYYGEIKFTNGTTMKVADKNLRWDIPTFSMGADLDVNLSRNLAFFCGINLSSSKNLALFGGNLGLGLYGIKDGGAFRADFGLTFQSHYSEAFTIVETSTRWFWGNESYNVSFYYDEETAVNFKPFVSLTFNTVNEESPVDFFFSLGYFTQNLLGIKPSGGVAKSIAASLFLVSYSECDRRSDCNVGFLYLNPGLTYSIADNIKLVGSVKICHEILLAKSTQSTFILPAMQINFEL